jgi:hypothetical protein
VTRRAVWRTRLFGGLILAGVTVVSAACGGATSPAVAHLGATTSTTGPTAAGGGAGSSGAPPYDQVVRYAGCMRAHGVHNFPNPQATADGGIKMIVGPSSGINPKSAQFQRAQTACQALMPKPTPQPQITPAEQGAYLQAAACMRSHGIAGFPDPVFPGGHVQFNLPHTMSASSPQFVKARLVCELLIPAGLPYSKQDQNP